MPLVAQQTRTNHRQAHRRKHDPEKSTARIKPAKKYRNRQYLIVVYREQHSEGDCRVLLELIVRADRISMVRKKNVRINHAPGGNPNPNPTKYILLFHDAKIEKSDDTAGAFQEQDRSTWASNSHLYGSHTCPDYPQKLPWLNENSDAIPTR